MACGCNKNKNNSKSIVSSYSSKQLNLTASFGKKEKTKAQIREELLKRMREGMA